MNLLREAQAAIEALTPVELYGEVQAARGPLIEAVGLGGLAPVGSCCAIARPGRAELTGEIIGFHAGVTLLLLHSEPHGVAPRAPLDRNDLVDEAGLFEDPRDPRARGDGEARASRDPPDLAKRAERHDGVADPVRRPHDERAKRRFVRRAADRRVSPARHTGQARSPAAV